MKKMTDFGVHFSARRQWLTCFDVDGTLINQNGTPYLGAKKLVQYCNQFSYTALCSARPMFSLSTISDGIGGFDYLSSCQGAFIVSARNTQSEVIKKEIIPSKLEEKIIALAEDNGHEFWFITEKDWFVSFPTERSLYEERLIGQRAKDIRMFDSGTLLKVVFLFDRKHSENDFKMRRDVLTSLGLAAQFSKPDFLEVFYGLPDKGLSAIQASVGIGQNRTISFGDGENDVGMFERSQYRVSFKSAHGHLRTISTLLLEPPELEGLVDAPLKIESFLGNDETR